MALLCIGLRIPSVLNLFQAEINVGRDSILACLASVPPRSLIDGKEKPYVWAGMETCPIDKSI